MTQTWFSSELPVPMALDQDWGMMASSTMDWKMVASPTIQLVVSS